MSNTKTNVKPTILVFSKSGLDGGLKKMQEKATVLQAYYNKSGEPAALLKAHPAARAIYIADPDIALPANKDLSRQVVEYVRKNCGRAILGAFFSSMITPPDFDSWMRDAWDLPWRFGQYERTCIVFQASATGRGGGHTAPRLSFSENVAPEDAWYAPSSGAASESRVFGPVSVLSQTAVAFSQVGKGWVGYTGDVFNLDETTLAVLAMMGLNVDEDAEEQVPVNPALAIMQQTGAQAVSVSFDRVSTRS